ncbi:MULTISPECIES: adenosylcobinamide-GDP ribazoletransferase [Roseobacteraceae]|jgi:adenosylcobinamide-GDP ribazoletransferase|uniref:Adenosylcobinamide-GDP ribazoletransferase n=1 Tax=Pseudosulfitobacter pseudonitzschiae TaxID=1402135 RepID=A0A221K1F2_9RHOB|nr:MULTISPECIES: adenosylcobinamide-GDP ribazoletransferase [Roseobacteraceae]ASM72801.1 adenosylcobinamide-GDP ribazoletransferase [Pseudosulfitobacter pseudonitzschiae]
MIKDDNSAKWDVIVALALLTRLPLPHAPKTAFARQAQAAWAFPLAGLAVALAAALVGWIGMALDLPTPITAGLMLTTLVLTTGAMHEDGLADTADGLWGGFDAVRRLEIMKDSRIGTYGVLALGLGTGLRWVALSATLAVGVGPMIAAAVLSRGLLPALMTLMPHARRTGLSHQVGRPDRNVALAALGMAVVLALVFAGWGVIWALVLAALAVAALAALAHRKIGGQTGDILGAAQQVAELVILLVLIP